MSQPHEQLEQGLSHQTSGRLTQALECYRLASEGAAEPEVRVEALRQQAIVHHMRSEWQAALDAAERAAAAAHAAGLPNQAAAAYVVTGIVHQARGNFAQAVEIFEQILASPASERVRGAVLQNLGSIAAQNGDFETARQRFLASHQCFKRTGDLRGEAAVLNNFGRAAVDNGNFRVAVDMLRQAVSAAKRLGNAEMMAITTMNHAEALAGLRELDQAGSLAGAALEHFVASGNSWRRVECLRLLGDIRRDRGELGEADRYYTDALAVATEIGAQAELEMLQRRRAALGGTVAS
jgi:tetratricopeptide (TPR) repeat protein